MSKHSWRDICRIEYNMLMNSKHTLEWNRPREETKLEIFTEIKRLIIWNFWIHFNVVVYLDNLHTNTCHLAKACHQMTHILHKLEYSHGRRLVCVGVPLPSVSPCDVLLRIRVDFRIFYLFEVSIGKQKLRACDRYMTHDVSVVFPILRISVMYANSRGKSNNI